ncbi:DsbA family protein [Schaalia odontolytica]|uniref:DsbA family protein n=1 Tax=Schaalia odontolytica TaxID=1660 RepID=UPI00211B986D|nr:DsbA family protein [Schaalia odontolytica]UUO92740.1 DsbA family protein [Schaalia odontolytica]
MTTNEAKEAASTPPGKHPSTPYKTLFFVTAPITAILAGACVWMGVQLASAPSASSSPTPTAAATAAGQAPANAETAAPSQTNQNNLTIMESFMRHQADDPQAKGDINAPVTLVIFSDFACPYCTKFAQEIDPALADLVEDGTLRVEWYDLAQITESSPLAAQAGIAAGEQGKFWEFHDAVYAAADPTGHPQYSQDALVDFAAKAGVSDLEKFRATMLDEHTAAKVSAAKERAHQAGITGTPTMFINKAFISGYRDASYVRATIMDQAAQTVS